MYTTHFFWFSVILFCFTLLGDCKIYDAEAILCNNLLYILLFQVKWRRGSKEIQGRRKAR
jgi:hypothetical protein